jgi:hypothetical protein
MASADYSLITIVLKVKEAVKRVFTKLPVPEIRADICCG